MVGRLKTSPQWAANSFHQQKSISPPLETGLDLSLALTNNLLKARLGGLQSLGNYSLFALCPHLLGTSRPQGAKTPNPVY